MAFDFVKCEYPLEISKHQGLTFNTKDFEGVYDMYTITEEGRLLRQRAKDVEAQVNGTSLNVVYDEPEDTNFDGVLNIYTSDESDDWVEYTAVFYDGILAKIED